MDNEYSSYLLPYTVHFIFDKMRRIGTVNQSFGV